MLTFHQDNSTISLKNFDRLSPPQHLTVPFAVPQVHILHTISMHPLHHQAVPPLQQDFLVIGSVLPLEVVISHTRKWWDCDTRSSRDANLLDFKYEVHAPPDDWTIGGRKVGRFSAEVSYLGDL